MKITNDKKIEKKKEEERKEKRGLISLFFFYKFFFLFRSLQNLLKILLTLSPIITIKSRYLMK
jgi:hypothetical protein